GGNRLGAPLGKDDAARLAERQHQRHAADLPEGEKPPLAVDRGNVLERAGRSTLLMAEQRPIGEKAPDVLVEVRLADDDGAVRVEQRDRRLGAEIDALEQRAEIVEVQLAGDDAGEAPAAILARARQGDDPVAGMSVTVGRADEEALAAVAVKLE